MVTQLKPASEKDDVIRKDLTQKSNSLPDPDVVLFFAGRLVEAEEKKKDASAVVTGIKKQMISAGIQQQAFALVAKAVSEGSGAIFEMMRQVQHIAKAFALPIGKQMSLFENPAENTDGSSLEGLLDQARTEGRMLGLMGKSPDEQKWTPNQPAGHAHYEGWTAGQEELQRRFIAMNQQQAQEAAEKQAADDAKAKKKADKEAKSAKTAEGETVQ